MRKWCIMYWYVVDKFGANCYLMALNATFKNTSFISWRSVLLAEETGGPGEKSLTNFIT
jgi:hypothetical protein